MKEETANKRITKQKMKDDGKRSMMNRKIAPECYDSDNNVLEECNCAETGHCRNTKRPRQDDLDLQQSEYSLGRKDVSSCKDGHISSDLDQRVSNGHSDLSIS